MPINYLRRLTSPARTELSNRHLGRSLAFVAGAINAGGFLAVGQYTSHMSGIVSALADDLVLGQAILLVTGASALLAFIAGAATSAVMINWGRRRQTHSEYAMPLMLEAVLLLCFGILGSNLEGHRLLFVPATVALLCYVMGLQNAMITKISRAEIRTTHVTGLVTDIGIEIGKMCYWTMAPRMPGEHLTDDQIQPAYRKLLLLSSLLLMFFLGGVIGAMGFKAVGFLATIPLAASLFLLALVPLIDDLVRN
ncbi:YoaK family protein [Herbaspirillum chlorophenolicum]|uniref:YoaK family protein n=1 Tax=Herbaspirillum chlorophenolicum TaxID=211589 RepID=UPI00067C9EDA|nr:YoaK family protein [Herbaspirillum chlorophenolicum]